MPSPAKAFTRELCIAPMMQYTDRHCRYFHRLLAPNCLTFTEMRKDEAVIHDSSEKTLGYSAKEHPIALQLGGSDIKTLEEAALIGEQHGYDEINLNCGCPSDRVQSGNFGAAMMKQPGHVAKIIHNLKQKLSIPVSIKCRLGVDDQDEEQSLFDLADKSFNQGLDVLYVHARKAWLQGLSPSQNRSVPALNYELAAKLKQSYPDKLIIINGGIKDYPTFKKLNEVFDGAMIGRASYKTPELLISCNENKSRLELGDQFYQIRERAIENYIEYCDIMLSKGHSLHKLSKPMYCLFHNEKGAAKYRRYLSQHIPRHQGSILPIRQALLHLASDIREQQRN